MAAVPTAGQAGGKPPLPFLVGVRLLAPQTPQPGATVELQTTGGRVLFRGVTGATGRLEIPREYFKERVRYVLVARKGNLYGTFEFLYFPNNPGQTVVVKKR